MCTRTKAPTVTQNLHICCFPGGSESKESACNAGATGDSGLIPGSGRFPRGGNGNPLQYSCLENPVNRGAWWAIVHGVAKSWTRLSDGVLPYVYMPGGVNNP